VLWLLYAVFWVVPRGPNFIYRRFGTLCLFHLHRQVVTYLPMKMETSAYNIQTPGNYPEECIQQKLIYCVGKTHNGWMLNEALHKVINIFQVRKLRVTISCITSIIMFKICKLIFRQILMVEKLSIPRDILIKMGCGSTFRKKRKTFFCNFVTTAGFKLTF
jgi:hypothetical protein